MRCQTLDNQRSLLSSLVAEIANQSYMPTVLLLFKEASRTKIAPFGTSGLSAGRYITIRATATGINIAKAVLVDEVVEMGYTKVSQPPIQGVR